MKFNTETQMWDVKLPDYMSGESFIYFPVLHIDHLIAAVKACEERNLAWIAHTHGFGWFFGFHEIEAVTKDMMKIAQGK